MMAYYFRKKIATQQVRDSDISCLVIQHILSSHLGSLPCLLIFPFDSLLLLNYASSPFQVH